MSLAQFFRDGFTLLGVVNIDFNFLNAKITGSLDFFNKTTEDLLFNFNTIQPAPAGRYWTNLDGKLINKGVELAINWQALNTGNSTLEFGFNISSLDNVTYCNCR